MPPKPFPFPLRVGVDIMKTSRITRILGNHYAINRWAQKIFNRLEWPDLLKVFQSRAVQVNDTVKDMGANKPQSQLVLPRIPAEDLQLTKKIIEYLAGRWAMKEAATKAHTFRSNQLLMSQVSILGWGAKAQILIDPPCATITMDARVASLRVLKHSRLSRIERSDTNASEILIGDFPDGAYVDSDKFFQRKALIKEEDRQVAEGSISHDGDFAVATCMALDEISEQNDKISDAIIDDGSGNPIHQPIWGDEGFLATESLEELKEAAQLFKETKGPGSRSVLFSGTKISKSLECTNQDKSYWATGISAE